MAATTPDSRAQCYLCCSDWLKLPEWFAAPSWHKKTLFLHAVPLTSMFSRTLRNVKAIPPPMIISSTLSSMFSISWILSATLALEREHFLVMKCTQRKLQKASWSICFSQKRKDETEGRAVPVIKSNEAAGSPDKQLSSAAQANISCFPCTRETKSEVPNICSLAILH